jgi:hypothetical protein
VAWIDFAAAGRAAGRLVAQVVAGRAPRELPIVELSAGKVARAARASSR